MHVYVAAFASLKNSTSDKTLLLLSIKILKVIEIFIKLEEVVSDDLILSKSEDLLRNHLNEDIIKFFLWTTLKLVYSFFKIKNKVDLNKEVKINKKILDSKLLSGGIENRFLPILSKDAVNLLLDMCEITTDNTIKQYLQGETKEIDEDQVLMSIIHQGKDKDIDRVIDLLQINLERKHPWMKSAREEDMRLSRAAFTCIIKFGKLYNDFTMMVDETGMKADSITIDDKNAVKIELAKVISKIDSYDTIFKHWESSAKMRSWYQEKKKNLANKIEEEAEEKIKEESREEQKGKNMLTISPLTKKTPLIWEKKSNYQIELEKIVEKVVEKAELLIKLSLPKSWDWKGLTKISIIETLSEEEEKEAHSNQNQNKDLNWMNRLTTLRNLQASEESIKNFEDLKNFNI